MRTHCVLNYDLCISTSWDITPDKKLEHGISGHTFEMIEYFWYTHMFINCCLLWTETMNAELLESILRSKYNFDEREIKIILDRSVYIYKPRILKVNNILLVDGRIKRNDNVILMYKHLFLFSCGEKNNHLIFDKNITVLQDYRIYESGVRTKDYKKKILFNRLRSLRNVKHKSFLYLTTNCRYLPIEEVKKCIQSFDHIFAHCSDREWIIGTNDVESYSKLEEQGYAKVKELPIENFMEEFNHYVYTPVKRRFDCSNRLLAECKYYDKIISLHDIDNDYLEQDLGLKYRLEDIKDLDSINIIRKDRDEIIDILRMEMK